MAEALINKRQERLVSVHWCSAEHHLHSDKRQRHRAYQKALVSAGVQLLIGHFVSEEVRCKECRETYMKDTEKQGDINVALQLIRDAYADLFDTCYLVSADSDQAATARAFREQFPTKELISVAPPGRRHSKHVLALAHGSRSIFQETVRSVPLP